MNRPKYGDAWTAKFPPAKSIMPCRNRPPVLADRGNFGQEVENFSGPVIQKRPRDQIWCLHAARGGSTCAGKASLETAQLHDRSYREILDRDLRIL